MKIVSVDTGGTNTRIYDHKNSMAVFPTPWEYDAYVTFLKGNLSAYSPIDALAVAVPAVVENGIIRKIPNLSSSWKGRNLAQDLRDAVVDGGRILILSDIFAAGSAVKREELDGHLPTLLVTLSTGVGAALITGQGVLSLELGHLMLNLSGENALCSCGQRGCVEADLSGRAIFRRTGVKPEKLEDAGFWSQYAWELGNFLLNMSVVFQLKQILLMGGISKQAKKFLPQAERYLTANIKNMEKPLLGVSKLGDMAGVLGGYWLAEAFEAKLEKEP